MNFTIVNKENIGCTIEGIPTELIVGKFLVLTHDVREAKTFEGCNNYFFDYFANIGYLSKEAEKLGAIGVLVIRDSRERHVCFFYFFLYFVNFFLQFFFFNFL